MPSLTTDAALMEQRAKQPRLIKVCLHTAHNDEEPYFQVEVSFSTSEVPVTDEQAEKLARILLQHTENLELLRVSNLPLR